MWHGCGMWHVALPDDWGLGLVVTSGDFNNL
jgi:hypothetical protein